MNPLTNVKNVKKLSEQELKGTHGTSWHDQYKDSAWIFVGGLPYDLTEGDIISVFSQYGEIVNINLVRDKKTGKQKGYCFLCFENQKSTILSVDNLNGIKLLGRTIRVDHVLDYKPPKEEKNITEETRQLRELGCATSIFPLKKTFKSECSEKEVFTKTKEKEQVEEKDEKEYEKHLKRKIDKMKDKEQQKRKEKKKKKKRSNEESKKPKKASKKKKRKKSSSSSDSSSSSESDSSNSSSESSS